MKKMISMMMATILLVMSCSIMVFADEGSQSLDDVLSQAQSQETQQATPSTEPKEGLDIHLGETYKENSNWMNAMQEASNISDMDIEGVDNIASGAKLVAGWIVQVICYITLAFLVVRIALDLLYIALPFSRSFLANGFAGQVQSSGNGMNGMGMGTTAVGGMNNGFGANRFGMQQGMAGMNGMNGMAQQNTMSNNRRSVGGGIQFVSNAALNAVASESAVGPDGKSISPYKIYAKDMVVTMVITPVLFVLATTGVLSKLGFAIGGFLVDIIGKVTQAI